MQHVANIKCIVAVQAQSVALTCRCIYIAATLLNVHTSTEIAFASINKDIGRYHTGPKQNKKCIACSTKSEKKTTLRPINYPATHDSQGLALTACLSGCFAELGLLVSAALPSLAGPASGLGSEVGSKAGILVAEALAVRKEWMSSFCDSASDMACTFALQRSALWMRSKSASTVSLSAFLLIALRR